MCLAPSSIITKTLRPPICAYRGTRLCGPINDCHIFWVMQDLWVLLKWDTTTFKNSAEFRGSRCTVWTCLEGFPSFLASLGLRPVFNFGHLAFACPGSKQWKPRFSFWAFCIDPSCQYNFCSWVFLGVAFFATAHLALYRTCLNPHPLCSLRRIFSSSRTFLFPSLFQKPLLIDNQCHQIFEQIWALRPNPWAIMVPHTPHNLGEGLSWSL